LEPIIDSSDSIGSLGNKDRREERLKLLFKLGTKFKYYYNLDPHNPKVSLIPDFDQKLNTFYWMLLDERIAPHVKNHDSDLKKYKNIEGPKSRVNRYKICSGLEIAIMRILPIDTESILKTSFDDWNTIGSRADIVIYSLGY
jgi:hypothetical protein